MYDRKRHPVVYYLKKLTPIEQNYDIYNKELLVIVAALQYQRCYIEGAPELIILSDYKNLIYFTTTKQLTRRQVYQLELLSQYKFEIRYTLGKDNRRADALSRQKDYIDKELVLYLIFKANPDGLLSSNTKEFRAVLRVL